MKKKLLTLAALCTLSLQASDFPKGSPKFFTSASAVMQAAKNNGKPVILVFSAAWCGPCQVMKTDVYPSSEVKPFHDQFNWAYLDIDEDANTELASSFQVESIPHIFFLDAAGKTLLDHQHGGAAPKDFAKKLTKTLQKAAKAKTAG